MADITVISVFDVYLIGIATILTLITAIQYFGLAKRKGNINEKSILKAYASVFVIFTIYLILLNFSFLSLDGKYVNHIYWGSYENPSLIFVWLTKFTLIFFYLALIFYFYTYEKILNKKIYIATISCILIIILIIILPYEFVFYQLTPITFGIIGLYFMHTLFKLIKWSKRELRADTSFIILGNWFMGIFMGYMSPAFMRLGVTPIIIFPVFLIIGILLCIFPTVFKPEFFSRNINYWYLFSIIIISVQLLSLIYTLIEAGLNFYILTPLILLFFWIIECGILIRFIKREKVLGVKDGIGIKGIFTKPEKISEEEVSVSKEKKICLVCKGKLGRYMFMCPDCNAFYCENCVRTLSDLENMCWVCDTPFDESKPVKPLEKEEQEVIVEKKSFDKKGKIKQNNKL
ncbi:MAG: hypothetical protein ACFFAH_12360 [Promethearchaeota archaeon]